MSSKKSDPLKSDTFAPAALLQVQPNYSSSPHISQSIGHVTSPLIAAKLLPMPGRTSVSPSTDSAQKGAAETPWQCKECGVGETETPLKRKGPDGTRV